MEQAMTSFGQAFGQGGSGALSPDEQDLVGGATVNPSLQVGITQAQPAPPQQPAAPPAQPQPTSRLQAILGAVAKTVTTGLAGIPNQGRPSFVTGLGEGARAEQAAEATQQAIKFKSFEDQVRLSQLHSQDQKLQLDTEAQRDAHTKADLDNRALANSLGVDYDQLTSHGPTVMDHLASQTSTNGAASVPPGTHLSGDGESINIPKDTQATRDGQKRMYEILAPALGLSPLPPGAQFVPPKSMNELTNMLHGYKRDGSTPNHDDLPGLIGAAQAQRDLIAKMKASPDQLTALDNRIGILKANLKALDEHKTSVLQADENVKNSPESIKGAADKASAVSDAELPNKLKVAQATSDIKANAAAKASEGSGWLPKVGADEKKKAELAENIAFNANEVAKLVMKRPDILGAVAGRFTNAQQMIGNNDPDISALGVHVHNMAMANSGVHGFRSQEGVESYERQLLNNFKNGPAAMAGALRASTGSVQTFIDNARPETYKTHSKQGGAVRAMVSK